MTSPGSPCPGEFSEVPCPTLQQYVSNPSIAANTTLLFQTGNHSLGSAFYATSAILFSMTGSDVNIECTSSLAQMSFSAVQVVYINGVTLMRCNRGISFTDIVTLTWNDSSVQQSNTYSAGVSPVSLRNMLIGYFLQGVFSNNIGYQNYGAINIRNLTLHINNSLFFHTGGNTIYAADSSEWPPVRRVTYISIANSVVVVFLNK